MEMNMNPRLTEAAGTGNIDAFYALVQEHPYMLEHIDQIPFIDIPLHIAAKKGQINFATEMMNLKPSFARKLNQDGFSPMHLAFRNGHTKLMLRLLKIDKDLVRVKGREGMTPFHWAATVGNSNLLFPFLEACPECMEDVTVRDETALHLASKNDHIEALNLLIGWLRRNRRAGASDLTQKVVNWRDEYDNTVLHITAKKEQYEALKLLSYSFINVGLHVRAKNTEGLTAREIIENVERNGLNMRGEDDDTADKIKSIKEKLDSGQEVIIMLLRKRNELSENMLNATLVIVALVITAVYQSSLSPPRGVWQVDNNSIPTTTSNITTTLQFSFNDNYNKSGFWGQESRKTGTTIMNPTLFSVFWGLNLLGLYIPVVLTLFLFLKLSIFLVMALHFLGLTYFYSMTLISPSSVWANANFILVFIALPLQIFFLYSLTRPPFMSFMSAAYKENKRLRRAVIRAILRANNVGIIQP